MHLDEFAVGVVDALLKDGRLRRAGADDGVGAFAENCPYAARGQNDGLCGKGLQLHRAQVHGDDAARHAFAVDDGGEELPALELLHFAFGLVAAHLLV